HGNDKSPAEAHGRVQTAPVPEAHPDRADPSEIRHEAAHHATTQDTRPAVTPRVMAQGVAEVAVLEDVPEEGARRQEHESENRNGQKRPKSGGAFKENRGWNFHRPRLSPNQKDRNQCVGASGKSLNPLSLIPSPCFTQVGVNSNSGQG